MPSFDGGDDFVGIGVPFEGLWHLVCLGDEAVDRGLEIDDRSKDAAQKHDAFKSWAAQGERRGTASS
jgi:hypothetical protein